MFVLSIGLQQLLLLLWNIGLACFFGGQGSNRKVCKIVQLAFFSLLHCYYQCDQDPHRCKAAGLVSGSGSALITIKKIGLKIGESDVYNKQIQLRSVKQPSATSVESVI